MNKEQVIQHGEVIKWFCDNPDKGVWCKQSEQWRDGPYQWKLTYEPSFTWQYKIVKNDEYAELRKAKADGEIIQLNGTAVNGGYGKTWNDCTDKDIFIFKVSAYRIKPKNDKFNVGDWVIRENGKPTKVVSIENGLRVSEWNYALDSYSDFDEYELWHPTIGELCIFWDDNDNPVIGIYGDRICLGDMDGYFTINDWENVAPFEFTQTLKEKYER